MLENYIQTHKQARCSNMGLGSKWKKNIKKVGMGEVLDTLPCVLWTPLFGAEKSEGRVSKNHSLPKNIVFYHYFIPNPIFWASSKHNICPNMNPYSYLIMKSFIFPKMYQNVRKKRKNVSSKLKGAVLTKSKRPPSGAARSVPSGNWT